MQRPQPPHQRPGHRCHRRRRRHRCPATANNDNNQNHNHDHNRDHNIKVVPLPDVLATSAEGSATGGFMAKFQVKMGAQNFFLSDFAVGGTRSLPRHILAGLIEDLVKACVIFPLF